MLQIHPSTFNEEDYKLIEKGGISISDSEDHIDVISADYRNNIF